MQVNEPLRRAPNPISVGLSYFRRTLNRWFSSLISTPSYAFVWCMLINQNAFAADPAVTVAAAREAFNARNAEQLRIIARQLNNTLFAAYPHYWLLMLAIEKAAPNDIQLFLMRYADSPLKDRLLSAWLLSLGKRKIWDLYLKYTPNLVNETQELACYRMHALIDTGNKAHPDVLRSLWFHSQPLPSACVRLLMRWQQTVALSEEDRWQRMRVALRDARLRKGDSNRLAAVRAANATLPLAEQLDLKQLEWIYAKPSDWLEKQLIYPTDKREQEVALFAINREAARDPEAAAAFLTAWQMTMPPADIRYAFGLIGYWSAYKHQINAPRWFREASPSPLSNEQLCWKARAGLRENDWELVLSAIDEMPPALAAEPSWQYWRASALAQQRGPEEATLIYQKLAKTPNYYGLLASEALGNNTPEVKDSYKPSELEIAMVALLPGIERALQLRLLGWETEANREWNWAIRSMDDTRLLAASELARRDQWFSRAIATAEQSKTLIHFRLRYLSPYGNIMRQQAKGNGLDEAWVYGLIRQESRFALSARSTVGAAGLMQLMPATAKWIAQRLGLSPFSLKQIYNTELNIILGMSYLKYTLDMLKQPVLATAAYNAGPGRARAWQGTVPLEGAIYIETIPFDETRDYVKKVFGNTMYYAALFSHRSIPLSTRLGLIPAKTSPANSPLAPAN